MKLPKFRLGRTVVPAAFFAVTVFLVSKYVYPLPAYTELLLWYSRLDPLLLLTHLRNELSFPAWGWLPLAALLLAFFAGRVFCGWLCPLGGLLALVEAVKSKKKNPAWMGRLEGFRIPWLLFLLGLLAFGSGWTQYLSPFHVLTSDLSRIWLHQIPWMLLVIVGLGIILFPRFWCVYLCPTGLFLSVVSRWRRRVVQPPDACIHCGLCERICPTGAAHQLPVDASADCILCGRCSDYCPAGAFRFEATTKAATGPDDGPGFTRREILRSGIAVGTAVAISTTLLKKTAANPLRPPGALEEDEFLARCSRCGRCIKACPAQCIKSAPISAGVAAFMTPIIVPRDARCEVTQHCQQVCPTGAIEKVPIEKALIGLAHIDETRCLGWVEGKLCLLCQEQCPLHAIDSDDKHRPTVRKELCVGCGACENGCPIESPPAIVVRPEPRRRRA